MFCQAVWCVVLSLASSKQLLLLQLNEEANKHKWSKYQELVDQCRRRGCMVRCELIKVQLFQSPVLQKRKPSCPLWKLQRGPPDGFQWGGVILSPMLLGNKPGSEQPLLGFLSEGVWCWKTWKLNDLSLTMCIVYPNLFHYKLALTQKSV